MSQEWKHSGAGEGEDVQMPLGTGEAPAEDYVAPRARINTSTVALALAFGAALVVLYFLGLQNKPRSASAEDQQRAQETEARMMAWMENKAGQQAVNGMMSQGERLIGVLQKHFNERSEPPDLAGNPFLHDLPVVLRPPLPDMTDIKPRPPEVVPEDPKAAAELRQAAVEYAGLKLQMIMLGAPSSAMINNQMVQVGSKFKYLTVTDIQTNRVLLGYKDQVFELTNQPK